MGNIVFPNHGDPDKPLPDFRKDAPLSPRKAMRNKCLDCCCGRANEVKQCHLHDCTLWPFRMGRGIAGVNGVLKSSKKKPRSAAQLANDKKLAARRKKK